MTEFDIWLDEVDAKLQGLLGVSIYDVEDFPYYAMWEDGETANDAALIVFENLTEGYGL